MCAKTYKNRQIDDFVNRLLSRGLLRLSPNKVYMAAETDE